MLDVCQSALKVFESSGCTVDELWPDYPLDAVWQAVLRIRGWQQGGAILAFYNDPAKRALLKPEAIYEIELGLKQPAYDITAASVIRSEWYQAVRRMFEKYDYFMVPTAQVFPFDAEIHWPQEIAGQKMETYHEWMKAVLLVSMSGCPALAVPAGFGGERNMPMGIQIIAPNHQRARLPPIGLCLHKRGELDQCAAACTAELKLNDFVETSASSGSFALKRNPTGGSGFSDRTRRQRQFGSPLGDAKKSPSGLEPSAVRRNEFD